jgi:two-component system CheB/CheR fusion protein
MDTDTGSDHNGLLIQLVELAFEPIFAWRPDRGIITWNSGCERLYGYSRAV